MCVIYVVYDYVFSKSAAKIRLFFDICKKMRKKNFFDEIFAHINLFLYLCIKFHIHYE